jgi:hypothetical protein
MTSPSGFRLVKWYLDAVSGDGEVFVGYHARLAFRGLVLRYASLLLSPPHGPAKAATTLARAPAPVADAVGVRWAVPRLGFAGAWQPQVPAVERRLLESPEGFVDWSCTAPAAHVRLDLGTGRTLEGWGYAEVLETTVRPWRLPIHELRWGRFVAKGAALVWIDWKGPRALSFAALDGVACEVASVGDSRVALAGSRGTLELREPRVLREGPLARTALARIPLLRERLPVKILQTHETKWLSCGTLDAGGERRLGWVVHEVVRWP